MAENPWDVLRTSRNEKAMRHLRSAFKKRKSASTTMELGVALLWVGDYGDAWEHFDAVNSERPKHTVAFYEMAGAAKWCLDAPDAAVSVWRAGLRCGYTDAAGGVTLPLLLFAASVLRPGVIDQAEVERVLQARLRNPRIAQWPGPLSEFVSKRIDRSVLRSKCTSRQAGDSLLRNWRADFYIGLVDRTQGELAAFERAMQKTVVTTDDDFDVAKEHFLAKLWHAEFFLARRECGPLRNTPAVDAKSSSP